jgi:MscS family membrane protein
MGSRVGQPSVGRKPFILRGWLTSCRRPAGVLAFAALLLAASLAFAFVAGIAPLAVLAQHAAQDAAIGTATRTGDPMPRQAKIAALQQDTPEAPDVTPEPPTETAEPAPSETVEPPPEATEPEPGEPSEPEPTALETPEPAETVAPAPTEAAATAKAATATATASATATATPTATATSSPTATPPASIWPADWPLGTVRIGAEESGPPAGPIRVTLGEWLRLAMAGVVLTLVATLGGRLLFRLLGSVITRRYPDVDGSLLVQLRPLLSWWLAAIGFHIAVWWVSFQNEPARDLFLDLAFLAYLGVATLTAWRLADRAIDLYIRRIAAEGRARGELQQAATIERLRPVMRRWVRALILLFSALVALGRLGVGFSIPTILVMLIGLTLSLAARDTLTDIIAGFSILLDQPFRVGDRIEVQGVDTWAEVVNIGLRTSVLLTRHNVEIIVPNSTIGKNQVINYTYPDPRYRIQTQVDIAFGTNVEHARRVMIDAVRQAPYVLPYEPVDALYVEIGDSAMIFRVRWWIDSYGDWERAYDGVHTALHSALAEAGIESPFPSQNLDLEVDDQTLAEVWQAWQGEGETRLAE